jgi:diketogulonate reductase-like aldo/keto reductase
MVEPDNLRYTKIPLNNGSGAIPALGFGTLIPDIIATKNATKAALEAGFRQLDTAERYRTEKEVGEAMQEVFKAGKIKRQDVFIATKLWNNNHRPERVAPAFEASLKRLQLDYVDLYLIHTPFAFQPGDEQNPRDANDNVICDKGVTLLDTWRTLEGLVDEGKCKAIGLSDVSLENVKEIFEAARIKPTVVHVEAWPLRHSLTCSSIREGRDCSAGSDCAAAWSEHLSGIISENARNERESGEYARPPGVVLGVRAGHERRLAQRQMKGARPLSSPRSRWPMSPVSSPKVCPAWPPDNHTRNAPQTPAQTASVDRYSDFAKSPPLDLFENLFRELL